jgi:molybdopterin-guanine dinucleotide biosynthesis protein A
MLEITSNLTGVILAGGRATRMGGQDKGLLLLNDKCMIEYVIAALRPQVGKVLISANRNQSRYAELTGCPVLADSFGHYEGPLAGMATCLRESQTDYVLFVPCDSPLLTSQLAERLYGSLMRASAEVCVADDGNRSHLVFALLKRSLLANLLAFLETGERKVGHFVAQQVLARADFSDVPETFLNINTPAEYATIVAKLKIETASKMNHRNTKIHNG